MIDNITPGRALGFLMWFRKFYNGATSDTYMQIANNYSQCNYGTIRNHIIELNKNGYIKIENPGKHCQKFIVIEEKFLHLI